MAYQLTNGRFQAFTDAGAFAVGYMLYTYDSGTTTPKATYTDATLSSINTNPIVLDARGEAQVWLESGAYTFVLKDTSDVTVWTVDGVVDPQSASQQLIDQKFADLNSSSDPSKGAGQVGFSGAASYPPGSSGLALQLLLNVKNEPINCKVDGVTDDLIGLNAALSTPRPMVVVPDGDLLVSTTPTNDYGVRMWPGRVLTPITGGLQQLNTYADDDKIVVGREYRYRLWERMRLSGNVKAFLYGDSTISDNNTTSAQLALTSLLPALAQSKGLSSSL